MDEDSFKFEIKVEVELKDGRLNTRIYAPDEELSKEYISIWTVEDACPYK